MAEPLRIVKQLARRIFAERKGIVRSHCDAIGADGAHEVAQRLFIMHDAVEVEPLQVLARRSGRVRRAEIGSGLKPMFDATERVGKRSAAMRETKFEFRMSVEHSTKCERTDCAGALGGHPHEPRHPESWSLTATEYIPWMNEECRAERLCRGEDLSERGVIEVAPIDVRSDLRSWHAKRFHRAFEFAHCESCVLHRQCGERSESIRKRAHNSSEVVVEQLREIMRVLRLRAIRKHHRHRREHLHVDVRLVAIRDAHRRIPAIRLDFTKELAVNHHPRATVRAVIERDPSTATIPLAQVRPPLGKHVRVKIDGAQRTHERIVATTIKATTIVAKRSTRGERYARPQMNCWISRLVLCVALMVIWVGAGGHDLHAPDEGRYASVSAVMADGGSWLVPHFRGHQHLTKPPMTYWLQALSLCVVGHNEWAVRLPSLIAQSLTVLMLYWFTFRLRGRTTAVFATGLYSVMIGPVFLGRFATTDALLNCFWVCGLGAGFLAIESKSARFAALHWIAFALAALTKGPLAAAPTLIIAAWIALGWLGRTRSAREFWRLHPLIGLPLALVPIGVVGYLIWKEHPEVLETLRKQTVGRMSGESEPGEPWWFYLPIFLVSFFPATALLTLPWFNMKWRDAVRAFALGDLNALMLIAVVSPLIFFSLSEGKMLTYLNPMGAPLALLVAVMLTRWVDGSAHARLPDVRRTLLIIYSCIFVVVMALAWFAAGGFVWTVSVLPLAAPVVAALFACAVWRRSVRARIQALGVLWAGAAIFLLTIFSVEARVLTVAGASRAITIAQGDRATTAEMPPTVLVGFLYPPFDFYCGRVIPSVYSVEQLFSGRSLTPPLAPPMRGSILFITEPQWQWMQLAYPPLVARVRVIGSWWRWFDRRTLVLAVTEDFPATLPARDPAAPKSAAAAQRKHFTFGALRSVGGE